MSNANVTFCLMSNDYICDNYISVMLQGDLTERLHPDTYYDPK